MFRKLQYFTNLGGSTAPFGVHITFTNGSDGQDSGWLLLSHGHVTANGDTFTPGSGLNAAFNNYTIWELRNDLPNAALDAGGCSGNNWGFACINQPPNNYFIIGSLGGNNYYLVNVHASNVSYMGSHVTDTPWLLASMGSGAQAQYQHGPRWGPCARKVARLPHMRFRRNRLGSVPPRRREIH
jgi:hypothetical protein